MTADEMWTELVARWLPDDPDRPTEAHRQYYQTKYRVAADVQPDSICEIGVRAGYSAFAMLAAVPRARYVGIDADRGDYGGQIGYLTRAAETLKEFDVAFSRCDSQSLTELPGFFDLVHVDGDHSYEGARHDVELGLDGGRFVLVDDYEFIASVRAAVDHYIVTHAAALRWQIVSDGGFRGNMLLSRKEEA